MNARSRLLSVVLPFAISSVVAACRLPEAGARERLEAEGLSGIFLVRTSQGFDFRALDPNGERCSGSLRTEDAEDGHWRLTKSCSDG